MAFDYKVLGQAAPADTSNADLYTVGAGKKTIVSSFAVTNVTGTDATYDIFVRVAGATAANSNKLVAGAVVGANTTTTIGIGVTLAATDVITVKSNTADAITFHAFGTEETT